MMSAILFVLLVAVGYVGKSASRRHTHVYVRSFFTRQFKCSHIIYVNSYISPLWGFTEHGIHICLVIYIYLYSYKGMESNKHVHVPELMWAQTITH